MKFIALEIIQNVRDADNFFDKMILNLMKKISQRHFLYYNTLTQIFQNTLNVRKNQSHAYTVDWIKQENQYFNMKTFVVVEQKSRANQAYGYACTTNFKEIALQKYHIKKTDENPQISQQPKQNVQPFKPDYKNFDYKQKYQAEAEQVNRPQQQLQAKHEILVMKSHPSLIITNNNNNNKFDNLHNKYIETKVDNYFSKSQDPIIKLQFQLIVITSCSRTQKQTKRLSSQTNKSYQRQGSDNQDIKNGYSQQQKLNGKYTNQLPYQERVPEKKLNEQRQNYPNSYLNKQQENKYYGNKKLDNRVIDKKFSVQNLQRQYIQQPESIVQYIKL
ncbi:unnamed protein product (macronuclear) [Paramecium tetraurelia]|uniref:Uncharacterized protein n=1 Tax=Paramecium tetraurelia TaxID=5888 RepID=A0BGD6_PARTE|nr:uncharacterized protein GSPATT00028638001 [Paramecium tetraurelia]CAK57603.1 unnamed protein product [Paramecium tetraurelia]|eukprot:XP_001425001.1 hypothetical protein (macronuclear) [Paramecium tetraurelia strain d4-2]